MARRGRTSRIEAAAAPIRRARMRLRGYALIFGASFVLTFVLALGVRALRGSDALLRAPVESAPSPAFERAPLPGAGEAPAIELAAARPAPAATLNVPASILKRLPVTRSVLSGATELRAGRPDVAARGPASAEETLYELVMPPDESAAPGPLRVEYTLDADLTREVHDLLDAKNVPLAHVVVMDPNDGRVLAYASTDVRRFPPNDLYPAASLIKVVTAAAALHHARARAEQPCRFLGSPYTLTPERIHPPRRGQTVTLERALATSNNQCFAQLAVHAIGTSALVDAIQRFGFLREPAAGHPAGRIEPGDDLYDLGRLGCGLSGCFITPLHAAQLAGSLAHGKIVEPYWVERVTDAGGHALRLPAHRPARQVMTAQLANELRGMLIETTQTGTARRGFRDRNGGNRLGPVLVAGKTGSLNGRDPEGRYEWFAGTAPADDPRVAIAVVVVQQQRAWIHASQLAGEVLERVFCERGSCKPTPRLRAARTAPESEVAPLPPTDAAVTWPFDAMIPDERGSLAPAGVNLARHDVDAR